MATLTRLPRLRAVWRALLPALAAGCAGLALAATDAVDLSAADVDAVAVSPLLSAAAQRARPLYDRHCASCHGAARQGDPARGVPNLADANWLWGDATEDSELQALLQTLRVGIRAEHAKTRRIADMPAFGPAAAPAQRLSETQIDELTDTVLRLAGQPHDAAAAQRGAKLFNGQPNCFDCHGADGRGNSDWGASDLTVAASSGWLWGNSRAAIRQSIRDGRAGRCPDWGGRLDENDLKALAVWLRASAAH